MKWISQIGARAGHDSLTGVLNLGSFFNQLGAALAMNAPVWLVMIEVDDPEADLVLLRAVAAAMYRPEAVVARGPGDEFVALLVGADSETVGRYCDAVERSLLDSEVIELASRRRPGPALNIGVAGSRGRSTSMVDLLQQAEHDLHADREENRARRAA